MFSAQGSQVANNAIYVDDVFSTYLYTGSGSTQTITNGIDLAGKGGLVWLKSRSQATENLLWDTARGAQKYLISSSTGAQATSTTQCVDSFSSTGFVVKGTSIGGGTNANGDTYASWTFRKQAKFFDVVTFIGNGQNNQQISHALASVPGVVIFKRTDSSTVGGWSTLARKSDGSYSYLFLEQTAAEFSTAANAAAAGLTSTYFSPGIGFGTINGGTYVAYLFAHDAGGFGATGTDNVISCGSVALDGTNFSTVTLGWEPQWVLIKNASSSTSGAWEICDNMRGMPATSGETYLLANSSAAEGTGGYNLVRPTATGFSANSSAGTYIYIAIRRPMKPPTSGTQVFSANYPTSSTFPNFVTSHVVDACFEMRKTGGGGNNDSSRLQGTGYLDASSTAAEATNTKFKWDSNTGYGNGYTVSTNTISWDFRRAPGFFDVVCYTGTGAATTVAHNLGVAPELMIVKSRVGSDTWTTYSNSLGNTKAVFLNYDYAPFVDSRYWNNTDPSGSSFTVGTESSVNSGTRTYVAYLFATLPGISKVGSYTGNGSSQTIDCGFAAGARFILIKATSTTGSWWIWDSARGILAASDPALQLNSTAAEVTSADAIDPASVGFIVNQEATCSINASGVSYIYFSVA